MNSQENGNIAMSENIIIAGAEYVDSVAGNLIVNFERMLNRALPKADFAQWAVRAALDGGVREGKNDVQVVLVHDKQREEMAHFEPGNFSHTLNAKAFNDAHLGEFTVTSVATDDTISKGTYFEEVMETLLHRGEVKRVMLIPDSETGMAYDRLRQLLRPTDDDTKRITLFAMEPMPGGNFRQELLGYSLMSALGIKADEINKKI